MGALQLTYEPKFKIVHRTGEPMRSHEAKSVQLWLRYDPLAESTGDPYAYCYNNPINIIDPTGMSGQDWFQNTLTGAIYYNSNMRKGDEGTGAMTGDGWEHMGPNGMFGVSDAQVLLSNLQLIDGKRIINTPVYNSSPPKNDKFVGFESQAMFSGDNATTFMDSQGYDFKERTSYSIEKHTFLVNQITSNGSVVVENIHGTKVVTSRIYVEKGMEDEKTIIAFRTTDLNYQSGYKSILKTSTSYYKPNWLVSSLKNFFDSKESFNDAHEGKINVSNNYINVFYGWQNCSDKELLKYKNK